MAFVFEQFSRACRRRRTSGAAAICGFVAAGFFTTVSAQFVVSDTVSIMPLGNSITEAKKGRASYRCWLWKMLTDAGIAVDFVGSRTGVYNGRIGLHVESACPYEAFDEDHEGHYSWKVGDVLYGGDCYNCYPGTLGGWLKDNLPDIVLLHLGSNDIGGKGKSGEPALEHLGFMIDTLRAYNASVVVLLATLIGSNIRVADNEIKAFNARIPALADRKTTDQSPVIVVDQAEGYNPSADNCDNWHPNETGEKKMARKWFEAISALCRYRPTVAGGDATLKAVMGSEDRVAPGLYPDGGGLAPRPGAFTAGANPVFYTIQGKAVPAGTIRGARNATAGSLSSGVYLVDRRVLPNTF
jgi:hypothetical protein